MTVEPAPSAVVTIGQTRFGNSLPLTLIAGPCALESRAHALEWRRASRTASPDPSRHRLVYKTSFDKANRTSGKARAVSASNGRCRSCARNPRTVSAYRRSPMSTSPRSAKGSPRPSTCCRSRRSCAVRTDLLRRRRQDRPRGNVKKGISWRRGHWRRGRTVVQKITGSRPTQRARHRARAPRSATTRWCPTLLALPIMARRDRRTP